MQNSIIQIIICNSITKTGNKIISEKITLIKTKKDLIKIFKSQIKKAN